jgi:hypothetical protein
MSQTQLTDFPLATGGQQGWPWMSNPGVPARGETSSHAPRISIVTPSFNQGQFIEETIRSVLLQGYPNLEYIIIDGGSTDQTVDIIRKYEPWLAYWVSEKDRGQSHAINKGFAMATGSVYCYLNSDDILFPGALHAVAPLFGASVNRRLVCCAGEFFGPAMTEVLGPLQGGGPDTSRPWKPPPPRLTHWLTTYCSLFQQACFWDKAVYEAIGGFSEELDFCFDKEFFLRAIFEFGSYVACPQIVAAGHRLHGECKTATISDVMVRENELLWDRYRSREWSRPILEREAREDCSYELMTTALEHAAFFDRAASLGRSARAWPPVIRSRMFWGAVRRLFRRPTLRP